MTKRVLKNEEELKGEIQTLIKKLYKCMNGNPEEKIEAIKEIVDEAFKKETEEKSNQKVFIEMAKNLEDPKIIAEELEKSIDYVYKKLRKLEIYTRKKVISMLEEKTDEEIAEEGHVNREAVARVRKEITKKKMKKENGQEESESKQNNHKELPKRGIVESYLVDKIVKMAKSLIDIKIISIVTGAEEEDIIQILKNKGVYTREQVHQMICETNKINEEIAHEGSVNLLAVINLREAIDQSKRKAITNEKRKVDFKIKRIELHSMIKHLQQASNVTTSVLNLRINRMFTEYGDFLTEEDYALFAYGYMKVREYMKAINLGEKYLELEDSSLKGLEVKIDEVLNRKKKKASESPNKIQESEMPVKLEKEGYDDR